MRRDVRAVIAAPVAHVHIRRQEWLLAPRGVPLTRDHRASVAFGPSDGRLEGPLVVWRIPGDVALEGALVGQRHFLLAQGQVQLAPVRWVHIALCRSQPLLANPAACDAADGLCEFLLVPMSLYFLKAR